MKKNLKNNTDLFTGPKFCAVPKAKRATVTATPPAPQAGVEPKRYPLFDDRYSHPIDECPKRAAAVDEINARLKARRLQSPPNKATQRRKR